MRLSWLLLWLILPSALLAAEEPAPADQPDDQLYWQTQDWQEAGQAKQIGNQVTLLHKSDQGYRLGLALLLPDWQQARPAVEAGERLGFLPGDLTQKIDPYLRPLYDALYDLMGADRVAKLYEKRAIEIAPLAFMRGRTLNHAFIILDEAQNTTPEQMKMFLTRIGIGAKAVVTGDITQIDLPKGHKSGLKEAIDVLRDVRGIAFTHFKKEDVVRHPLVARIVDAYDAPRRAAAARARD